MSEWLTISPEEQRQIAEQGEALLNQALSESWAIIEQLMALPPIWNGQRTEPQSGFTVEQLRAVTKQRAGGA